MELGKHLTSWSHSGRWFQIFIGDEEEWLYLGMLLLGRWWCLDEEEPTDSYCFK